MDAKQILTDAHSILLVDYPGRIVPDTLARLGLIVFAHGGPAPDDYFAYEASGSDVVERRIGLRPAHTDIVFSYRPLDELPGILDAAVAIGARTLWFQNDGSADAGALARAEARVTDAGLLWVCQPILDAAR